jgi:hypothetical protein
VIQGEGTVVLNLPGREYLEQKAGRKLSDDEVIDIHHRIEKGIEGQLDWDILVSCALDSEL